MKLRALSFYTFWSPALFCSVHLLHPKNFERVQKILDVSKKFWTRSNILDASKKFWTRPKNFEHIFFFKFFPFLVFLHHIQIFFNTSKIILDAFKIVWTRPKYLDVFKIFWTCPKYLDAFKIFWTEQMDRA